MQRWLMVVLVVAVFVLGVIACQKTVSPTPTPSPTAPPMVSPYFTILHQALEDLVGKEEATRLAAEARQVWPHDMFYQEYSMAWEWAKLGGVNFGLVIAPPLSSYYKVENLQGGVVVKPAFNQAKIYGGTPR